MSAKPELTFDPRGGEADARIQKLCWERIALAMEMLKDVDLQAVINSIEMGDTFMPFLDPTAYMNAKHEERRVMVRLATALKPAVEIYREAR